MEMSYGQYIQPQQDSRISGKKTTVIDWSKRTFNIADVPYQTQTLLGAGSHAGVWLARGLFYPNEEITIKIAHQENGICQERVQNEIWFLKQMNHEHIPPLLDTGIADGFLWFAMPLYQKLTITIPDAGILRHFYPEEITPDGYPTKFVQIPFAVREKVAMHVLRNISKAVAYIAGTGIVHADISPCNIMEKRGSMVKKQYVLTDWGASSLIHRYPEKAFGSLHFTAPERLMGEIGVRSDLFSLGVTCFYIMTGRVPYIGNNGEEYYASTLERDGISVSSFIKEITPAFDKLIRDLIRREPYMRPDPATLGARLDRIRLY